MECGGRGLPYCQPIINCGRLYILLNLTTVLVNYQAVCHSLSTPPPWQIIWPHLLVADCHVTSLPLDVMTMVIVLTFKCHLFPVCLVLMYQHNLLLIHHLLRGWHPAGATCGHGNQSISDYSRTGTWVYVCKYPEKVGTPDEESLHFGDLFTFEFFRTAC